MRRPKLFASVCSDCGYSIGSGKKKDPLRFNPSLRNTHELLGGKIVCPKCSGANALRPVRI